MGKFPIVQDDNSGGQATSIKQGTPNSFASSRHLDFRKDPMALTVLPAATKESGLVVTDLVTNTIQLPSGKMVAIGDAGHVYTRSTGGTWADTGTILPDTAYGLVYNLQQDTVYIPGKTTMHNITNADGAFGGSLTVNKNVFTASKDQSSANGHAQSYTILAAIDEGATNRFSITPTIEPLYSVKIWVATKGTGDILVTMHDGVNDVLGTATLLNANVTADAYNEFVFSTPPRMYVKPNAATYHFHATFPNGTASTLGTSTTNDCSTVDYQSWSNRFVSPVNGCHPILEFLQYYLIGNGRYVSSWEPISQANPSTSEFQQHRLTLPSGYEVTSMAPYANLYAAIGAEKRSTSATNEFQSGYIFLWDGTSTTYNDLIEVPEGSPFSLFSYKKVLYYYAGGAWMAYAGASPVQIFQMPGTDFEGSGLNTYVVNNPYMMAVRNKILLMGFPSNTNSLTMDHAVYSFGQRNKNYPNSFGYSYSISTLTRQYDGSHALQIGMIKSFGDKLFISWRDDTQAAGATYGVDKVDPNSPPYTTFLWESLINDFRFISIKRRFARPDTDKQATRITITAEALPTGCTVRPKYKINREANWHYIDDTGTNQTAMQANDTTKDFYINKRYREIQIGFEGTTTAATPTTPKITSVVLIAEMLPDEAD
jgi:hypothetical protein